MSNIPKLLRFGNSKERYLCILGVGLLIRLAFAPFTRDPWDMDVWASIGNALLKGQNPYALSSNALLYPPLWAIFCAASTLLYNLTTNVFVQYLTIKIPIITADILISIVVGQIVYSLTGSEKKAQSALILYLFNPVTIIISSVWGMFDAIPSLFALLSTVFLLRSEYLKSGLILGLGIAFKGFFPAMLLPFFLFSIWEKEKNRSVATKYLLSSILIPIASSIPFLFAESGVYISSYLFHLNRLPRNLTYWFSISALLGGEQVSTSTIISVTTVLSITLFLVLYIVMIGKGNSRAKGSDKESIFKGINLVLLVFFVTSIIVNEQYLIWLLPFLIVYFSCYKRSLMSIFYALTGLDAAFIILNVGPRFFSPLIQAPALWNEFQYSLPSMISLYLIGIVFSVASIFGLAKLVKNSSWSHMT
jgi:uncharacterized membrane protein